MGELQTVFIPSVAFAVGWIAMMMLSSSTVLHGPKVQLVIERVHDGPWQMQGGAGAQILQQRLQQQQQLQPLPNSIAATLPARTPSPLRSSSLGLREEKLLVLVIAGGDLPRYRVNRSVWRMIADHVAPLGIEIYLVAMDDTVSVGGLYDRSLLFPGTDSLVGGVLNATLLALEHVYKENLPGSRARFVLRTNLSSFWVFNRLLAFIANQVTSKMYAGVVYYSNIGAYASGAGMIMSRDMAEQVYKSRDKLNFQIFDDEAIGEISHGMVPRIITMERCDFYTKIVPFSLEPPNTQACPKSTYHYRVKSEDTEFDSKSFAMLYMYYYAPNPNYAYGQV